jgi:hypothetical protein
MNSTIATLIVANLMDDRLQAAGVRRRRHDPSSPAAPKRRR